MVGTLPAKNMSLLQRTVTMSHQHPDDYYDVDYERLMNGTPEESFVQFDRWKYSTGQMIYVKDIPDEMDEDALREIFGKYGWIDTIDFVREDRRAIIKFTNIYNWDFTTNIYEYHPEPCPIALGEYVLHCSIHIPETETNEKTVSQLVNMMKRMEKHFIESIGELTDRVIETNNRLLEATEDFEREKTQMKKQIKDLTDKLTDITNTIIECTDEF